MTATPQVTFDEMGFLRNGEATQTLQPMSVGYPTYGIAPTENTPLDKECKELSQCLDEDVLSPDGAWKTLDDRYYKPDQTITELQAGWNVTNAIQGMFIVSFPYAVYQGGYWALFAMGFIAAVCCYTGKILVECLYETGPSGKTVRARNSYVEIAECVWGRNIGSHIVNAAQLIELLMTCILYILLCGQLLKGTFPDTSLDLTSWILVASILIYPYAFLKTLRSVSTLSLWNFVAHLLINAIIIIYCFTRIGEWHWSAVQISIDIWTFPISLGVIVFSYTSQIFVATLEGNMIDNTKFPRMMHWTHAGAALFKIVFGYVGFLTFGAATQEVITNNLPGQTLKSAVNFCLVLKALLSYPLPYFAAVEIIEDTFFRGVPTTRFPTCWERDGSLAVWALALRLGLCVVTVAMAIFVPHFAILMGFIGSCTGTMLSLVWPCWFHLKIKTLTQTQKALDIAIITGGMFFAVIGIYYSGHALVRAFQGLPADPLQVGSAVKCQFTACEGIDLWRNATSNATRVL